MSIQAKHCEEQAGVVLQHEITSPRGTLSRLQILFQGKQDDVLLS